MPSFASWADASDIGRPDSVRPAARLLRRVGRPGAGEPARIVVLGGGFGGVYAALHLEQLAAKGAPVEASLVNRENHMVFQPMLAEIIAGDVGILDTVSPGSITWSSRSGT